MFAPSLAGQQNGAGSKLSPERRTLTFMQDGCDFLSEVKHAFRNKQGSYNAFLQLLTSFKAKRIDLPEVVRRAYELFEGNHELVMGFEQFIPEGLGKESNRERTNCKPTEKHGQQPDLTTKCGEFLQTTGCVEKTKARLPNTNSQAEYQRPAKRRKHQTAGITAVINQHPQGERAEKSEVTNKVQIGTLGDRGEKFRQVAPIEREKQINEKVVKCEWGGKGKHSGQVKEKHESAKCRRSQICETVCKVDESVDNQPLEGKSVEKFEEISLPTATDAGKKVSKIEFRDNSGGAAKQLKLEESVADGRNGMIGEDARVPIRQLKLEASKDDMDSVRDGAHDSKAQYYRQRRMGKEREEDTLFTSPSQNRGKIIYKSIANLDLSQSASCTPSYRLLPMKYLRTPSQLHPLRAEVLNDYWVSVTSGDKDYSLEHTERNPYEEKLFQCEDDRYELDVLVESTMATIKRMEELVIRLGPSGKLQEDCLDDHLTAIDWRRCEQLYDEYGLEIIDQMRSDPGTALPVVLKRLKQKRDEWLRARDDFNKCMMEVYANNYKKMFDHKSTLSTKDSKSAEKTVGKKWVTMAQQRQERRSVAQKRREKAIMSQNPEAWNAEGQPGEGLVAAAGDAAPV